MAAVKRCAFTALDLTSFGNPALDSPVVNIFRNREAPPSTAPTMSIENLCMRCLWALVLVAGCTVRNPAACVNGHCPDPGRPFCDVEGAVGGDPGACIAVSCTAKEFEACQGDQAVMCNSNGTNYDVVACEFGCSEAAGGCNACNSTACERRIVPRYVPTACEVLASSPKLEILTDRMIDTDAEGSCTSVVEQVDGPPICVIHHGEIKLAQNRKLKFKGSRAVALIADRNLTIDGHIDVSADLITNGPGGGFLKSGGTGVPFTIAGGGAGHRTPGGSGGTDTFASAANGGSAQPNPATLAVLRGGTQAAQGAAGYEFGGGGGGAITAVACRGAAEISGVIDAGGGGGSAGYFFIVAGGGVLSASSATGGGAGGTIVVQGQRVRIAGALYANGGGGGGDQSSFEPGQDALASPQAARGGGMGGAGGFHTPPAGGGKECGGGGSAGYILTYTPNGVTADLTGSTLSPDAEPNGKVATN